MHVNRDACNKTTLNYYGFLCFDKCKVLKYNQFHNINLVNIFNYVF